jgi:hypothetical protein
MFSPDVLLRKVDVVSLKRKVIPENLTLEKKFLIEQIIDSVPLMVIKDLDKDILRLSFVYLLKINFGKENVRVLKSTTRDKVKQVLIFNYSRLLMKNFKRN